MTQQTDAGLVKSPLHCQEKPKKRNFMYLVLRHVSITVCGLCCQDARNTSSVTVWDSMDRKTYMSKTRCWEGLLFILTCSSLSLRFLEVTEWRMNKRFPWEKPSRKRDFFYHPSPRWWWGRLSIRPHCFFVVFLVFLYISLHITFYRTDVLFYFYMPLF